MLRQIHVLVATLLATLLMVCPALGDDDQETGFLGVATGDAPDGGALVSAVLINTPASAAGVQVGDVVVKIGGVATNDHETLLEQIRSYKPDAKVKLEVVRDGKPLEFTLALSSRRRVGPLLVQRHPPRAFGGEFENRGTHSGDLNLQGTNHLVIGRPVIEGDYTHGRATLMVCRLNGPKDYSSLGVTGSVDLDGTLCVELGDYDPRAGRKFELIRDAKFLSGKFRHLMLPLLPPELTWEVVYDDVANKRDLDNDGKYDVTLIVKPVRPGKK